MKLLPGKKTWATWDWATRFGVVTGILTLVLSFLFFGLKLFDIDIEKIARAKIQELTASDPWENADPAWVKANRDEVADTGQDIIGRINSMDLDDALDYHREYAEGRCYRDETFRKLMTVRIAMAKFLYNDPSNPYANEAYNEHPDLAPFLSSKRPSKLLALHDRMVTGASKLEIRDDLDLKLFAKTLLEYYDKIHSTEGWLDSFKALPEDHLDIDAWWEEQEKLGAPEQPFRPYANLFPVSTDFCINDASYGYSLDTYLYSFWWRRWHEGTMLATKISLETFDKLRIFPVSAPES